MKFLISYPVRVHRSHAKVQQSKVYWMLEDNEIMHRKLKGNSLLSNVWNYDYSQIT